MIDTFEISWNDNVKARLVNLPDQNKIVDSKSGEIQRRSQWDTYEYLKNKLNFEDS
jgi:polyphosphate kinase